MRILQIVILTLIVAYPDQVFSIRKGDKKKVNKFGPCGKRYLRQINGKCYYFAVKKMNWFGAQNNCLRKGLNLADLSTSEDYTAVLHFLRSRGNMEDYWFGGNDLQSEGRFTYISNGRLVRYLGESGVIEPTQRSNLDDCLEVRLRENNTVVTDDNCQENQYFVCEKNLMKCSVPTKDESKDRHHSHEHLHHFHHDPSKIENQEELESDSRPDDNKNSTEEVTEAVEKTSTVVAESFAPEENGTVNTGEEKTTTHSTTPGNVTETTPTKEISPATEVTPLPAESPPPPPVARAPLVFPSSVIPQIPREPALTFQ